VGIGLAALMEWLHEALAKRVPASALRWRLATPVLAIALLPLAGNRLTAPRTHETLARDYAEDVLQSLDPYAIVVTAGDNDTFPLWYAQEVRGVRRDVTVLCLSLANTDWYLRQMQRRPITPFDSTAAPAVLQRRWTPPPASPPLAWTARELDTLEEFYLVERPQAVRLAGIDVSLDPARLHPVGDGRGYLERADVVVLEIIKDQLGKRPIYFGYSTGSYPDRMFGLAPYLEGQGLVRQLRPYALTASDSIEAIRLQSPGGVVPLGWVNVPRTSVLALDVYHGGAVGRPRSRGWVDRPSVNILVNYAMVYSVVASALEHRNPERAGRAAAVLEGIDRSLVN
jgi:hypothetical protein